MEIEISKSEKRKKKKSCSKENDIEDSIQKENILKEEESVEKESRTEKLEPVEVNEMSAKEMIEFTKVTDVWIEASRSKKVWDILIEDSKNEKPKIKKVEVAAILSLSTSMWKCKHMNCLEARMDISVINIFSASS